MKYARVALGLPVDEVFDYLVPEQFSKNCSVGCRVGVSFGKRNLIAYVVGLSLRTRISKIKPISRLIDLKPILGGRFLELTKAVSDYYCSSWGQAIEAALPFGVRKGLPVGGADDERETAPQEGTKGTAAIKEWVSGRPEEYFKVYCQRIDFVLARNKSVLILAPEIKQCVELFNLIKTKYPDKRIGLTYRKLKLKEELAAWEKAVNGCVDILIGTRAAVFSPLPNLGLIIIDREDSYGYKEEQAPYYQAVEVGRLRARLEGIPLVLSSQSLSLDAYYDLREKEYSLIATPPTRGLWHNYFLSPGAGQECPAYPSKDAHLEQSPRGGEIIVRKGGAKIILVDLKQYGRKKSGMLFSPVLEDKLNKAIPAGKKVLVFINRKGYSLFAHCQKCGFVLSCDKCSSRLIFHFEAKKLVCGSCGFKKDLFKICPNCNAQYIKYSGFGIEKVISQLSQYFPQAKIVRLDKEHQDIPPDFQIMAATEKIFHFDIRTRFAISAVIDLDSVLNTVDFRNNERLYRLLGGLKILTEEELILQTRIPEQYQNNEFLDLELDKLFEGELKERKELGLPPYTHLTHINLRGKNLERTRNAALGLYEKLKGVNKATGQLSGATHNFPPHLTSPTRGEGITEKYLPSFTNRLHTNKEFEIFEPVEAIPFKLRGNFRFYILLKARNQLKLSKFLKKQLKKIRYSGVILTVDVDPE